MKRTSLYDCTYEELNKIVHMTKGNKYRWYDAAMVTVCREFDDMLVDKNNLGEDSVRLLPFYKQDVRFANNIIISLRQLAHFIATYANKKTGMLTEVQQKQYDYLCMNVLDLFDQLEKHKQFDCLKEDYQDFLECVSQYFCLSYLEYMNKNFANSMSNGTMIVNQSFYDLVSKINDSIVKKDYNQEDIDDIEKLVGQAECDGLSAKSQKMYFKYIDSFCHIIKNNKINKR